MTQKTKQNILELYDQALDQTKAIREISKAFDISRFELADILFKNGRPIPAKFQYKNDDVTKDDEADCPDDASQSAADESDQTDEAAVILPIPNYIFDVLMKELDSLDMQINALSQKLADLSTKYTDISNFIKEYKRP